MSTSSASNCANDFHRVLRTRQHFQAAQSDQRVSLTPALAVLPPPTDLDKLHIILLCKPILEPRLFQFAFKVVDVRNDFRLDDVSEHVKGEFEAFQCGL